MEITKKVERDSVFDIVRALCAIEVVAFWHLGNYMPERWQYSVGILHWGEYITWGCLATFSFLSGYFLSKYQFKEKGDIWGFYKKRLTRFYFLYAIAVLSLWIGGLIVKEHFFESTGQVVLALLGLGEFATPYPPTVWYFCMIVFFYLVTPLVGLQKTPSRKFLIIVTLFVALLALKLSNLINVDERLLMYYPFYFGGLIIPHDWVDKLKKWWISPVAIFLWIVCCASVNHINNFGSVFVNVLFVAFIISLGSTIDRLKIFNRFFYVISYASMTAYLFHRHFYLFAVFIMYYGSDVSMRDATLETWSIPIVLVLIFILSYYIQFLYDKCIYYIQDSKIK